MSIIHNHRHIIRAATATPEPPADRPLARFCASCRDRVHWNHDRCPGCWGTRDKPHLRRSATNKYHYAREEMGALARGIAIVSPKSRAGIIRAMAG
jgi:hypothetical protein